MGGMLAAVAFIVLVARAPGLVPLWLSLASYPTAALVAFTSMLFLPLFVFTAWVAAVVVTLRGDARRTSEATGDP